MTKNAPILEFDEDRTGILMPDPFTIGVGTIVPSKGVLCFFHDVIATLLENEKVYRSLFIKDKMRGPEFQVRVAGLKIAKAGGILVMCFNDRQEDSRGGSHTAYALAIPSTKLARIYMAIETDPSIMIDIFRRLYPTYDRSGGQLAIDPGCPKVVPMAEDIIK